MAVDALFGWDLTFKTVEKDIKRKSDVIVAFIHWNLTKRGFRSIGIGDERTLSGDEEKTELLPTGWNDKDNYALRYVLGNKLFILHGLNTDGNLIVNLMRSEDLAVSNIAVKIDDTVKYLAGPIDKMMPTHKDLMYHVKRDLIDTVSERTTVTTETQTSRRECHHPVCRTSEVPTWTRSHPAAAVCCSTRSTLAGVLRTLALAYLEDYREGQCRPELVSTRSALPVGPCQAAAQLRQMRTTCRPPASMITCSCSYCNSIPTVLTFLCTSII